MVSITIVFVWFFSFILLCVIFAAIFVSRLRSVARKNLETANQMEDILESAPDGYFCMSRIKGKDYTHCSRRLCLLLNIVETNASLSAVLKQLDAKDARLLTESFQNLIEKGMPFELTVSTDNKRLFFVVIGRVLYMSDTQQNSYVMWFKDMTRKTALLIEERQAYTHLLQQREILTKTLNTLPFPLYVEDKNGTVCFANKAYTEAKDDFADMHWINMPLALGKNSSYALKYGQDKTTEEGLSTLLADADRAHKAVLKEIPFGVVLFDSNTRLVFFNNAFSELWNIDSQWLKKEPLYASFLDKIQEKGLLPQVKDFAQYKKVQLSAFAQLTKTTEEFLYLPGGQIVRRLMIPHANGGILILDERKMNITGDTH
ncbi:MAG: PAS domain-containing protein [Alphaproteobacteria bacterium]|nr:PAS domain-containing protein [Alphaproteobacteria bacterium]